jgi:single-strand DNA-binding protein
VVIFSEGVAKVAEQYLKKGSKVYIEGQLQTRKWQDQQGQDRYSTEVVLQGFNSQLVMLDKANGGADGSYGGGNRPGTPAPAREPATPGIPHDDKNDEVPFQGGTVFGL